MGAEILSSKSGQAPVIHQTYDHSSLRVSSSDETESSAWYVRFTKLGSEQMRLEMFMPAGRNSPTEEDFLTQLDRDVWKPSVNNHDTYRQIATTQTIQENTYGELDSVNLFSNLKNVVSSQLGGIEWVSVRAVRLD